MNTENRLPLALLLLRLSVFLVMFVWTVDKFVEPQHASKIMAEFYSLSGVCTAIIYLLAVIELAIILAFLIGIRQTMELWSCTPAVRYFDTVILSEILKPVPTS
jgi:hypothetical protein